MLHPTIEELTTQEFNRYEIALATAKCARLINDEYVRQREEAERSSTGNKEADRNLISSINKEYRDEKAVKTAIAGLYDGEFRLVKPDGTTELIGRAALMAENADGSLVVCGPTGPVAPGAQVK